jgi:hypothetical protein
MSELLTSISLRLNNPKICFSKSASVLKSVSNVVPSSSLLTLETPKYPAFSLYLFLNPKDNIGPINFLNTQKKGRKNSAPKVTRVITFFPDGAIISLIKSNLGSFSLMKLFMYFESMIGILDIKSAIALSSRLPSTSIICLVNFRVTEGETIPFG